MISRSSAKPLASWDASKQATYRQQHPEQVVTLHMLLDASPSMAGEAAVNLRKAYALYLAWLQQHADPMSLVEVVVFSTDVERHTLVPLGRCQPLTEQTYDPLQGDGTALYRAIGEVVTTVKGAGQQILVVLTDGLDNRSEDYAWTSSKVFMLLKTLQEQDGWLCVFLGAFPTALEVGKTMGFHDKNCLVFTTDQIPEAFHTLRQATQRYLAAAPAARKLLAAGGIF